MVSAAMSKTSAGSSVSGVPGRLSPDTISLVRRLIPLIDDSLEPYAVGGFLRDAILGRDTRDLDLTVSGNAIAAAGRLAQDLGGTLVPLDMDRGIARVAFQQPGVAWNVDIASLQGDRLHDLARRDFTIDAMTVPLQALAGPDWPVEVTDPFNGRKDLEQKVVRAVDQNAFMEDGIRLLRAVRLAAVLDFTIDEDTQGLIRRDVSALDAVSGERIRDELLAILATSYALKHVYLLDHLGLLCRVVPELEQGRGVTQPREHYWDVFTHNVETVGAVEGLLERTWQPQWVLDDVAWNDDLDTHFRQIIADGHTRGTILKLTGLLHDIAKPVTRTVEEDGRIRFLGHSDQGARMASAVLNRLRLSKRASNLIETVIEHHLRPAQMSQGTELATPRAVHRYLRSAGDAAVDILYLNLADYLAARGSRLERDEWSDYTAMVTHILHTSQVQEEASTPRLVDGNDLIRALGLDPGPDLGRVLELITEARAAGEISTADEALALARNAIAPQPGSPKGTA